MNASDNASEPCAASLEDPTKVAEPLGPGPGGGRRFLKAAVRWVAEALPATVLNLAFPIIFSGIVWGIAILTSGLAFLTAPNDAVTFKRNLVAAQGWRGYVEYALLALILLVLVIVPGIFNAICFDVKGKGHAQGALLKMITLVACALTGYYIFLLHAKGGALQNVHERPLIVGAIFTLVLLAPYYKSLARACWQGGLGLLSLSALTRPWSEMRDDWREAKELRKSSVGGQIGHSGPQ